MPFRISLLVGHPGVTSLNDRWGKSPQISLAPNYLKCIPLHPPPPPPPKNNSLGLQFWPDSHKKMSFHIWVYLLKCKIDLIKFRNPLSAVYHLGLPRKQYTRSPFGSNMIQNSADLVVRISLQFNPKVTRPPPPPAAISHSCSPGLVISITAVLFWE